MDVDSFKWGSIRENSLEFTSQKFQDFKYNVFLIY